MSIKQRRSIANYLHVEEAYELCGVGFTDLNENPSAQTSKKRYINQKSSTTTITGYDWSAPLKTDMIRSDKVVDFICGIGEKQLTGSEAESDYIIVDLDKTVGEANTFYARKIHVAIEVSSFESSDGDMVASGNFVGSGDIVEGKFNTQTKTFTASEAE